jgi:hypothetical protein
MPAEYTIAELGTAVGRLIAEGKLGLKLMHDPGATHEQVRAYIEAEVERRKREATPVDAADIFGSTISAGFVAASDPRP